MRRIMNGWTAAAALLMGATVGADTIDYQVTDYAPASIKVAGDGTVFVDYVNPTPGMTYYFNLNLWVEEGGAAAFPSEAVPVKARKLSGTDVSNWFTLTPAEAVFTGYGGDPASTGGNPTGSYVPILVSIAVPSADLPKDGQVQVKIQADTSKIKKLGNGHGFIVRFSGFSGGGDKDPGNPGGGGGHGSGCCCHSAFTATSWLTDAKFVPLCLAYGNRFSVRTTCEGKVLGTTPTSVNYNILVSARRDVKGLTLTMLPQPKDFVLAGRTESMGHTYAITRLPKDFYTMENSVQVYVGDPSAASGTYIWGVQQGNKMTFGPVDIKAGGILFMTVHLRFNRCTLFPGDFPRIYAFSAVAAAGTDVRATAARMFGEQKKTCTCGGHDVKKEPKKEIRPVDPGCGQPGNGDGGKKDGKKGNDTKKKDGCGDSGSGQSGGDGKGRDKTKGNNGVGNGEDPQPPGDPKVNDGAGTGPGNPGNKGGAKK